MTFGRKDKDFIISHFIYQAMFPINPSGSAAGELVF